MHVLYNQLIMLTTVQDGLCNHLKGLFVLLFPRMPAMNIVHKYHIEYIKFEQNGQFIFDYSCLIILTRSNSLLHAETISADR